MTGLLVSDLGAGSRFYWSGRLVEVDGYEEEPGGRRRPGRWVVCHEVDGGRAHRLHYFDDEWVGV